MEKFQCNKCGKCCRELGIKHYLPLREWEVEPIKKLAQEKNIKLDIRPLKGFKEKKTNVLLPLNGFGMFNEPCPFLIDNQCSIYENRPIICKTFPIAKTEVFAESFGADCFMKCNNFDNKKSFDNFFYMKKGDKKPLKKSDISKFLQDTYGEIYDYSKHIDIVERYLAMIVEDVVKKGKLKLKKVGTYEANNSKVVNFLDFLAEKKLISNDFKEQLVSCFIDKEKFKELLEKRK